MSRGQILPPDVPIPENHGDHAAAAAQDQNAQADIVPGPGPDAQQSAQARQEVAEAVPFPHDRIFPVVGPQKCLLCALLKIESTRLLKKQTQKTTFQKF